MNPESIAVIIPCYNEALTIGKVIDDFHRELPQATVYVYDNNSSDDTSRIATEHGATVRFEPRQGKGNVCRQMFRDIDAACYLMVDGDDTYPAEAAKALCEPILNGMADMTVGDRLSNGTYAEENKRAFHGFGNNLVRAHGSRGARARGGTVRPPAFLRGDRRPYSELDRRAFEVNRTRPLVREAD